MKVQKATLNQEVPEAGDDPVLIGYDLLKHITSLSIVAVGGILALFQASGIAMTRPGFISIALVGGSSILGVVILNSFAFSHIIGRRSKRLPIVMAIMLQLVVGFFVLGIGVFVGTFVKVLG